MPFTKTTWVDDSAPDITATQLNRIEQGVADAHNPPLVSALPGSPGDGEEIRFQTAAMAADGIVWTLRYRAGSASTYKWEFVGGAPLAAEVEGTGARTSAVYGDCSDVVGPAVTPPLAGEYLVEIEMQQVPNAAQGGGWMSYAIGASAAVDADNVRGWAFAANFDTMQGRRKKKTLTAGQALVAKYAMQAPSTSTTFGRRRLAVQPVRVG